MAETDLNDPSSWPNCGGTWCVLPSSSSATGLLPRTPLRRLWRCLPAGRPLRIPLLAAHQGALHSQEQDHRHPAPTGTTGRYFFPDDDEADVNSWFDDAGHWTEDTQPAQWGNRAVADQQPVLDHFRGLPRPPPRGARPGFHDAEVVGLDTDEIYKTLSITSNNCWVLLHRRGWPCAPAAQAKVGSRRPLVSTPLHSYPHRIGL